MHGYGISLKWEVWTALQIHSFTGSLRHLGNKSPPCSAWPMNFSGSIRVEHKLPTDSLAPREKEDRLGQTVIVTPSTFTSQRSDSSSRKAKGAAEKTKSIILAELPSQRVKISTVGRSVPNTTNQCSLPCQQHLTRVLLVWWFHQNTTQYNKEKQNLLISTLSLLFPSDIGLQLRPQ